MRCLNTKKKPPPSKPQVLKDLSTADPIEDFAEKMRTVLEDGTHFIAQQIGLPECFLWNPEANYDPDEPNLDPKNFERGFVITENDHCWHEYGFADTTEAEPTYPRTPEQFLKDVSAAAKKGWEAFLPSDRKTA